MTQNGVDATMMLAAVRHFGLCEKASGAPGSEPPIRLINGKLYAFDFVKAALDHAVTCTGARSLNIRANPFAPTKESVMTSTAAEQPEPQPELPAALDLSTAKLHGVAVVVNHNGTDVEYYLAPVADWVPHQNLPAIATCDLHTARVTTGVDWELDAGQTVTLFELTGNGQYLVIGKLAYHYDDVVAFLERCGEQIRVDADPYMPPAWSDESQQVRHMRGLGLHELDAEDGQLLPDRTHGLDTHDTGLTELPPEASEDYDREAVAAAIGEANQMFEEQWFSKQQRLVLTLFGVANCTLLVTGLGASIHQHYNIYLSMLIAMIAGSTITAGIGAFGAIVASKYADRPLFAQYEYQGQRVLHTCGALIGWTIMTLGVLSFLF